MSDKNRIKDLEKENKALTKELNSYRNQSEQSRKINWWVARKFTGVLLGKDLKVSVKQAVNEMSEDKKLSKDSLSDLISSLIKRFLKVGVITILLGLLPTLILVVQTVLLKQQNNRIDKQNILITEQNNRLTQQTNLQEAERRGSLVFLFGNIMDAIDRELKEPNNVKKRDLSGQLKGRIIALSTRLKPYRYFEADTLISKPLSPERGQLLYSLIKSDISKSTLKDIFSGGADFSYADLQGANLMYAYLDHIKLDNANLNGANLTFCEMNNANLMFADMVDVKLSSANINSTDFRLANMKKAYLKGSSLVYSELNEANLKDSTLDNCNFSGTILHSANLDNASLRCTDLSNARFHAIKVDSTFYKMLDYYYPDTCEGDLFLLSNFMMTDTMLLIDTVNYNYLIRKQQ